MMKHVRLRWRRSKKLVPAEKKASFWPYRGSVIYNLNILK
jgi:hypothetical protein